MPAPIPDRFRLEVRLGSDGDIEEWLATDTSLDRPVLVRSLGPESGAGRRRAFVDSVSAAARVSHPHLASVFAVSEVEGGAYSISEWTGGATVADRVEAAHPIDPFEFLPNASGLAAGLAALHAAGGHHGAIDPSAIAYSGAHPAKLGAFGRRGSSRAQADVRALAGALETALTGAPPGGPPPSERVDGISAAVDRALRRGQQGELTANELSQALAAAPTPRRPRPEEPATSRRVLIAAVALVLAAAGLVALGRITSGGGAPILPQPAAPAAPPVTAGTTAATSPEAEPAVIENVLAHDPFGEGGENDDRAASLVDGDMSTAWSTEGYPGPLADTKPGVGVMVTVSGTPQRVELVGLTPGTAFELRWSGRFIQDPADWELVARARSAPGPLTIDLPPRVDGFWLVWLTELPPGADGSHRAQLAELRFPS